MGSLATPLITRLEYLKVGTGTMARAQWHGNNGTGTMAQSLAQLLGRHDGTGTMAWAQWHRQDGSGTGTLAQAQWHRHNGLGTETIAW